MILATNTSSLSIAQIAQATGRPDKVIEHNLSPFLSCGGELGTSYFLPRAVGIRRAAEILFTGRTVDAAEAEKIGLISRLVDEDALMKTAMETARLMLGKSLLGLRLTKEVLYQNLDAPSLEAAIELENRNQSICCTTPDFFKAVEAFSKGKKK